MTAGLVLSTDELRVSATLHGGKIQSTFDNAWSAEDIPVADVVALRGLLAKGLVIDHGTSVTLTQDIAATIGPLLTAHTSVEAQRDGLSRPGRWLVAETAEGVVSCAEDRPDIWSIRRVNSAIAELFNELTEQLSDTESHGKPLRLRTDLLVNAERTSAAGGSEHVPAKLTQAGLAPDDAETVARILADLQSMVTVRSMRGQGTVRSATTLTWLETSSVGMWLAVPDDDNVPLDDSLPESTGLATYTELRPTNSSELRTELWYVLTGKAPRE